ncbi:LysR family transcriptional regulator [Celeribacter indicus]|uniref:LysR family transcriptional regulator n=1 Tax=Celeribacter indicus TaxID=1208324 RepID=A0A0B5DUL4_9RHOB|nr:LysR family transcriptional regulator [Celeribacter indicus]AJE46709.1 LysR family transcriptional regulator [Celeribacter indicus]SDX04504.1 transcriptional regulator, LysR family [Celeribacter indicus]
MNTLLSMELLVLSVSGGSFSAAGRRLNMSPASVSRHINALEDRLGVRLLNRSSRSLTLTEAGQEYYRHAQRILPQVNSAENRTRELGKAPHGTIRVHSRMFVGSQLIVPALPDFLRRHPGLNVSLIMSNTDLNLNDQNLDIDIRMGRPPDSNYAMRRLGETRRVVVASPEYLAQAPALEIPDDLHEHQCLIYTQYDQSSIWSFVDEHGERIDVPVIGRFNTNVGTSMRDLTLAGLGVTMLPEWAVRPYIANGQLVQCLPGFEASHTDFTFDTGIYAVFVKGRYIAAKTRLFLDFLVELFGDRHSGTPLPRA